MRKIMKRSLFIILSFCLCFSQFYLIKAETSADYVINVIDYGADPLGIKDSTIAFQEALDAAKEKEGEDVVVQLEIPKGEYHIYKDHAYQREYHTSNTNSIEHPIKTIGLLIEDHQNLIVNGNDSLLMMHGNMMAMAIVHSENITLNDFGWDFAVPTVSEMTITGMGEVNGRAYTDYYIPTCFPYEISGNNIIWNGGTSPYTNEYYWTQRNEHNTYGIIIHQPELQLTANYAVGGNTPFGNVYAIEPQEYGVRIIYHSRPNNQTLGAVYELCGSSVRETAGAFTWESKNVTANRISVHYMHGFGWLMQMSENLYYNDCHFMPRENSGHLTVSFADILHASGSKGDIVIDGCEFSNSHDDPINLHGTFTRVASRVDDHTAVLKYIHAQQGGFPQFHVGDKVQFFTRDTLQSTDNESQYTVAEVISNPGEDGNDLRTMKIRFEEVLPSDLDALLNDGSYEPKYVAENVTYAPIVTIRNNTFKNVPTRGILCTTRNKVIIENNEFLNMSMATIFLSNDSNQWYESGPIRDLTIQNNTFYIKNKSYPGWSSKPAILIHPVVKSSTLPSKNEPVHKNIKIIGNTFYMENDMVVQAECVDGLTISNNHIKRRYPNVSLQLSVPNTTIGQNQSMNVTTLANGSQQNDTVVPQNIYHLTNCSNVTILDNTYDDGMKKYAVINGMEASDVMIIQDEVTLSNTSSNKASDPVSKVYYMTSDASVIEVDQDGKIIGKNEGNATIHAYYITTDGTIVRSNTITMTCTGRNENPLQFNNTTPIVLKDDTQVSVSLTNGDDATLSQTDFYTKEATDLIEIIGQKIKAKRNGIVWLHANGQNGSDQIPVIVSLPNVTAFNTAYSITRKDEETLQFDNNSATITMIKGDLYQTWDSNNLKNLILYDVPAGCDEFFASVDINGLPARESNQWDTASFLLYSDDDNYISVGKKSHYDGYAVVKEQNGSADEKGGNAAYNDKLNATFGFHVANNQLTIYYKTENEWIEADSFAISYLGSQLKLGFGAWASNLRNKQAIFSNFKFSTEVSSLDELSNQDMIPFMKEEENKAPIIQSLTTNQDAYVNNQLQLHLTYTDEENDQLSQTYYLLSYLNENGSPVNEVVNTDTFVVPNTNELKVSAFIIDEKGTPSDVKNITIPVLKNTSSSQLNVTLNGIPLKDGTMILPKEIGSSKLKWLAHSSVSININGTVLNRNAEGEMYISLNGVNEISFSTSDKSIQTAFQFVESNEAIVNEIKDNNNDEIKENDVIVTSDPNFTFTASKSEQTDRLEILYGYSRAVLACEQVEQTYQCNKKLSNGLNTFYVKAIAKDGITTEQKIFSVIYQASKDANIEEILLNDEAISNFDIHTINYRVDYPEDVEKIKVNARGNVVAYLLNGQSIEANQELPLQKGLNTLLVKVKSLDGISIKTYEIQIVRAYATNVELISMEMDGKDIFEQFESGERSFGISSHQTELSIKALDEQATLIVNSAYESIEGLGSIDANVSVSKEAPNVYVSVIARDGKTMQTHCIHLYKAVYLSDLTYSSQSSVGYGSIMKDQSSDGNGIRLIGENGNAVSFVKGLGTHADSTIIYDLSNASYTSLKGYAGLDYEVFNNQYSSVSFEIKADGISKWNSNGMMLGNTPMKSFDIDITNVKTLQLIALKGENDWSDHADWADMVLSGDLPSNDQNLYDITLVENENVTCISNYQDKIAHGQTYQLDVVSNNDYVATGAIVNGQFIPLVNNQLVIENVSSPLQIAITNREASLNKEPLEKIIQEAEAIELGDYYEASWNTLQEVIEAAKAALERAEQQIQIDTYVEIVQDAIDGLILRPARVTNLDAYALDYKTIQIDWDAVDDADYYQIYRLDTIKNKWIPFKTSETNRYTVTGVKTGIKYSYRVIANKVLEDGTIVAGKSSSTNSATALLEGEPILTLKANGQTKFDLSWTKVKGATRYLVYRKSNSEGWKKILTLGGDVTTYTTSSMVPNTYTFMIKAARYDSKERVQTNGSNTQSGTSSYAKPVITLSKASTTSLKISWKAIEGIKYYELYRSTSSKGTYRKIKTLTTTSYTNKSLTKGKTYYYKVRGYRSYNDQKVYTSYSTVKSYTVK